MKHFSKCNFTFCLCSSSVEIISKKIKNYITLPYLSSPKAIFYVLNLFIQFLFVSCFFLLNEYLTLQFYSKL